MEAGRTRVWVSLVFRIPLTHPLLSGQTQGLSGVQSLDSLILFLFLYFIFLQSRRRERELGGRRGVQVAGFYSLSLFFFFFFWIFLPDRNPSSRWRCSGTPEFPRNRKSPPSKSQTTPSSSRVRLSPVPQEEAGTCSTGFTPVCGVVFQALLCTPRISAPAST